MFHGEACLCQLTARLVVRHVLCSCLVRALVHEGVHFHLPRELLLQLSQQRLLQIEAAWVVLVVLRGQRKACFPRQ